MGLRVAWPGLSARGREHLCSLAAALLAVALLWPRPGNQDFCFSDAARHGMDGLFVLDMLRDGAVLHPYTYGLHYSARYPAVGVVYYPPLFALCEAGFYWAFGLGLPAARAAVMLFAIAAAVACYKLGRALRGPWFGMLATLCFLTMYDVLLWGHDVMLEIPLAAMSLLTALFLHRWVDAGSRGAGYACFLCLVGALLTKQTGVFLLVLVPAYVLLRGRARLLWSREALLSYLGVTLVLTPYGCMQWAFYRSTVISALQGEGPVAAAPTWGMARWVFYLRALPYTATPVLAVLAVGGLATCLWRRRWDDGGLLALWFAVGYLSASYVCPHDTRYSILFLPSAALLAPLCLWDLVPRRAAGLPALAIAGLLLAGYQVYEAATANLPWVSSGYRRAAEVVTRRPCGETTLFHGYQAGNFVYHVRAADRARRQIVLRSDKLFGRVHRLFRAREEFTPTVATWEDVAGLLAEHGVGYVVLEPNGHSPADSVRPLLERALSQSPWVLDAAVPVASHLAKPGQGDILVFRNPAAGRARAEAIPLWVPLSQDELKVTYEDLRREHQAQ